MPAARIPESTTALVEHDGVAEHRTLLGDVAPVETWSSSSTVSNQSCISDVVHRSTSACIRRPVRSTLYSGYERAEGGSDSLYLFLGRTFQIVNPSSVPSMHDSIRNACVPVLLLVSAALPSCQGFETIPETGRTRPKLQYTEAEMAKLGAEAYEDAISEYKVITGTPEADLVNEVARKIAAASGKNYTWEFKLLDAPDTINAFCLPGGKIAVFSGVLPAAAGADGLAVILGHEVAHATLQHGNERISQLRLKRIIGAPANLATNVWGALAPRTRRAVMDGLGLGVIFGKALPYSQEHESEADEVGLGYMRDAGFDVEEAPKFWRRMVVAAPTGVTDSLSTHPDAERRAKRLEELIRESQNRVQ